jgi:hypothetical protein
MVLRVMTSADTEIRKCGILLKQHGLSLFGKTLADGTIVTGASESIQAELHNTWKRMRSPERSVFVKNMSSLRDTILESAKSGEANKTMMSFSQYFTN